MHPSVLVAEGGWQSFELGSAEWTVLILSAVAALLAIAAAYFAAAQLSLPLAIKSVGFKRESLADSFVKHTGPGTKNPFIAPIRRKRDP